MSATDSAAMRKATVPGASRARSRRLTRSITHMIRWTAPRGSCDSVSGSRLRVPFVPPDAIREANPLNRPTAREIRFTVCDSMTIESCA